MTNKTISLGKNFIQNDVTKVSGNFVEILNEKFYKIENYNAMPDFFMSIVSNSDHFMFISSNGALTAGRKNKNNALFPYYTDDKIHDYRGKTGSKTILLIKDGENQTLWEPFSEISELVYDIERNIYKSIYGNKVIFEEINNDLGLRFRYGWYNSEKFGIVKKSSIKNISAQNLEVSVLDGMKNILPSGVDYPFQNEYSNLLDAYKKNELVSDSNLACFSLSSIPVDRPEPSEALLSNTVWSLSQHPIKNILISENQIDAFKKGQQVSTEKDVRARRGSYYIHSELNLDKDEEQQWLFAADINQSATQIASLKKSLQDKNDLENDLENDILLGTNKLKQIVASSDGMQCGNEELSSSRHFANTLYNVMRGGIFSKNYALEKSDLILYFKQSNRRIYNEFIGWLNDLPESIEYSDLILKAEKQNSKDLLRICTEYLPLTFSRRHGDPSRPWNNFSIETQNEDGSPKLNYEGNWRDIFQNWEALSLSYPQFLEGMIAKFFNATTADGYNPYRITREGIDWEVQDPDDPWAFIGYWGDHQIIYLQKLLEQFYAYAPDRFKELLSRDNYVFAHVPYEIKAYDQIVRNPKDTIDFNSDLNLKLENLYNEIGADGKLLRSKNNGLVYTSFIEKILITLLAKMSNYIPEAGIWLNTQRPEWNDANNALVGNGVSMVTLYYIRRFLSFWNEQLKASGLKQVQLSEETNELLKSIHQTLSSNLKIANKGFSDAERKAVTEELGRAGESFRNKTYKNAFKGKKEGVETNEILEFISHCLVHIDHSIKANKRADGLYHAYNLVSFKDDGFSIRYLYEMLEGQVAVLSSGCLSPEESLEVLDALKNSKLFREDQYSYILYPDRELTRFEDKNFIAAKDLEKSKLLQELLSAGDVSIVEKDIDGNYHFNAKFRNAALLEEALDKLADETPRLQNKKEKELVLNIYENIFDHQSFTGRSGTFYGYEGLGSIYWHMVSKLLLATQECFFESTEKSSQDISNRLKAHYYEIKAGIGLYKSPDLYGAFPTDAYSHTPGKAGVKQPGLTGQVKEDVISRFGELGLRVLNGQISFNMTLLNPNELLTKDSTFDFYSLSGDKQSLQLAKDQLAFTYCQTPFIYKKGDKQNILISYSDGHEKSMDGNLLSKEDSKLLFSRNGTIKSIHVNF